MGECFGGKSPKTKDAMLMTKMSRIPVPTDEIDANTALLLLSSEVVLGILKILRKVRIFGVKELM